MHSQIYFRFCRGTPLSVFRQKNNSIAIGRGELNFKKGKRGCFLLFFHFPFLPSTDRTRPPLSSSHFKGKREEGGGGIWEFFFVV